MPYRGTSLSIVPTGGENPSCHSRGGAAGASHGEASWRESQLDKAVAELFQKGIAPATKRTYGSAKGRYIGFCRRLGRPPLPTSEARLCQFVALLVGRGWHTAESGLPVSSATFSDRDRMGGPRYGVHGKVRAGPEGNEEAESRGRKAEVTEEANDTGGAQNQLE